MLVVSLTDKMIFTHCWHKHDKIRLSGLGCTFLTWGSRQVVKGNSTDVSSKSEHRSWECYCVYEQLSCPLWLQQEQFKIVKLPPVTPLESALVGISAGD